jgi:hypothetical protein
MAVGKTDNEFVNWNYIDVRIPLDKINSKLFFRETISPRLRNEFQDMDVVVLRSELGYKNSDWLKSSLGYDWFRRFNSLPGPYLRNQENQHKITVQRTFDHKR